MDRRRKEGFTLIELLVVIAIIALLMAVIMPALKKCKESARTAVCAAQIRQFGLAWNQYADENDGKNIYYADYTEWDQGGFWFYRLGPYISADNSFTEGDRNATSRSGVIKLLNCPAAKQWAPDYNDAGPLYGAADMAWKWTGVAGDRELEGSYTLNAWMQQRPGSSDKRFYSNFIDAGGSVPLISDGAWVDAWPNYGGDESSLIENQMIDTQGSGYSGTYRMPGERSSARVILSRHGDAVNIVFRDTHVEKIDLERMWSFSWHNDFERVYDLKLPRP